MNRILLSITGFLFLVSRADAQPPGAPLVQAHSHNDYEHRRPLLDALEHGFCSVEADVWLTNGQLLVAHDLKDLKTNRTLEALYLAPLADRIARNSARVFSGGPPFTLLIDIKSDSTNTYLALREQLRRYEPMLTRFHQNRTETNAVIVIVSGNRPRVLMAAEASRLAAYDGRLEDLESSASPHFIPLVSDNWMRHFQWRAGAGEGPMPERERSKLRRLVELSHRQGRRIRWWSAPDNVTGWKELAEARVDLINTDNLPGLRNFLQRPGETAPSTNLNRK